MSAETRAACALGIGDEKLSALRDELLSADEAERLRAHAATCDACRERLEGFERVGAALRGQRLAGPSARLWDDVRAAIASGERTGTTSRFPWMAGTRGSRPAWSGLGAVAATLAVALLFALVLRGALVGRGGTTSRVQPTATLTATQTPQATVTPVPTAVVVLPVKGTPPDWHEYTLPGGLVLDGVHEVLDVTPENGDMAYVCSSGGSPNVAEPLQVRVTSDRGAHWTWQSNLPSGADCLDFAVDQINPDVVIAHADSGNFVSRDGGRTWSHLAGLSQPFKTATLSDGRIYAVTATQGATGETIHFAVSTDGMRTWRTIDSGISSGTDDDIGRFWRNPANGHLLVATFYAFWESDDGGQTWSRVALPSTYFGATVDYVVQRPSGDADWHICSPIACSTDGGRTWTALPQFLPSDSAGDAQGFALAITSDSSLLATGSTDLYRLPAGGTRWEDLGPLPAPPPWSGFYPLYAPVPGTAGALWALPPGGKGAFSQYYSALLPTGG